MIDGIDINQRIEFTFSDDTEPKTVVILKPINGIEIMGFSISNNDSDKDRQRLATMYILETSIVELKNVKEGITKQQFIESLNLSQVSELLSRIESIKSLTSLEKKT